MKIASVRIENFRSFKDETIPFNNYACFVGPNGAGKSTVLTALNVFFRESNGLPTDLSQLEDEDFHCKETDEPVKITVTFKDLDEEATEDFSDYVRQGQLVVSAVATFDQAIGKADVKQYGQRLAMLAFAPFFKALDEGKKVAELKDIYSGIRSGHEELPAPGTKDAMIRALHEYEAGRPEQCELIPSEDQFYGFSKGTNRLARHVQWVYVPAVKDATSEQVEARNSALGKLLARTVRSKTNFDESMKKLRADMQQQYQELLDGSQDVLNEISKSLQSRLSEWAHPDARLRLQWKQDPDKSVRVEEPWAHILAGEGDFEGELARFGHGLQRSYLLALLQELSGTEAGESPTLILACEEPELYQHPPQARHLAAVLNKLSHGNSQVIVSTHNPWFVSGEGFEDVRMVRKEDGSPRSMVCHMSFKDIAEAVGQATGEEPTKPEGALAKIHQALQPALNEMFFTRRLILVEGLEDVAYLQAYFNLLNKLDDFRRLGCHIVAANGKSELLRPLVISNYMKIPTYLVFDSDADKPDRNGSKAKHEKDNKALFRLAGGDEKTPFPDETVWGTGFTAWHSDIGAIVKDEIGAEDWAKYRNAADQRYGHVGDLKKNFLHIGASLAFAWEDKKQSESLAKLCASVLETDNFVPFA
ncbi:ATP-dependent nuclease [Hoeflea poritis]|uniref:AAA family ATPase n=1 Tax=Hoeflea poritis TaxID=2993659 RepID=A0ABT4VVY0_9HYPH|nr:AAA family ATPase [Hoeflea poritis]MDA4848848.1 AAA family ATPase [Hoeflea poritis]